MIILLLLVTPEKRPQRHVTDKQMAHPKRPAASSFSKKGYVSDLSEYDLRDPERRQDIFPSNRHSLQFPATIRLASRSPNNLKPETASIESSLFNRRRSIIRKRAQIFGATNDSNEVERIVVGKTEDPVHKRGTNLTDHQDNSTTSTRTTNTMPIFKQPQLIRGQSLDSMTIDRDFNKINTLRSSSDSKLHKLSDRHGFVYSSAAAFTYVSTKLLL